MHGEGQAGTSRLWQSAHSGLPDEARGPSETDSTSVRLAMLTASVGKRQRRGEVVVGGVALAGSSVCSRSP